jgi:hypothetical protein
MTSPARLSGHCNQDNLIISWQLLPFTGTLTSIQTIHTLTTPANQSGLAKNTKAASAAKNTYFFSSRFLFHFPGYHVTLVK